MGIPKALMPVAGRPWCLHQRERLDRAGLPATWVVSDSFLTAASSDPRALQAASPRITADSSAPMFASILRGIAHILESSSPRPSGLFILPVDVPAARPEIWHRLAASAPVAVPTFHTKRGHPVYLSWDWIDRRITRNPGTHDPAQRLDSLIAPDTTLIEVDDPDIAVNLNTPDDVTSWLASRQP